MWSGVQGKSIGIVKQLVTSAGRAPCPKPCSVANTLVDTDICGSLAQRRSTPRIRTHGCSMPPALADIMNIDGVGALGRGASKASTSTPSKRQKVLADSAAPVDHAALFSSEGQERRMARLRIITTHFCGTGGRGRTAWRPAACYCVSNSGDVLEAARWNSHCHRRPRQGMPHAFLPTLEVLADSSPARRQCMSWLLQP